MMRTAHGRCRGSRSRSESAGPSETQGGARSRLDVIAFSRAMFDHAYGYRNVYFALLNTGAWPLVRQQLQDVRKRSLLLSITHKFAEAG